MRTDDLVLMLARGPIAVASRAVERRFVFGMAWGLVGSAGLMIALVAFFLVLRLARPGSRLGSLPLLTALPVLLLWVLAAVSLYQAESHERTALVLGQTWAVCSTLIALLSSPVFVGVWRVRGNERHGAHAASASGCSGRPTRRCDRNFGLLHSLPGDGRPVLGGLVRAGDADSRRRRCRTGRQVLALVDRARMRPYSGVIATRWLNGSNAPTCRNCTTST